MLSVLIRIIIDSLTLTDSNLILLDATLAGLPERAEATTSDSTASSSSPTSPYLLSAVESSSLSSEACTPPDLELPKPLHPTISGHAVDLIRREIDALTRLANRIEGGTAATSGFNRAVALLAGMHPHAKLIVTGLGKSALIGRKAVATFCSLGACPLYDTDWPCLTRRTQACPPSSSTR
jgi:hypothetical protein